MMDAEGVPIWYVFNESDMCSPEQPERLYIKTVDMNHLIAYVPEDAGTCQIEERHGDWYCTGCGEMVGTCDTASELCIDGNAIELWRHCPNCGRKVVTE